MVNTTYTRQAFGKKVYDFVRDVIRHRNMLISRQLSATNKMKTLRIIEELARNNNRNYNDRAAALFFLQRADDILYLIKGDDTDKIIRFREFLEKSKLFSKL